MRTLQAIEKRQAAIRGELLQIEQDSTDMDEAQRSQNATYTDTLLQEFDELEEERKPLAERMKRLDAVVHAATETEDQDNSKVERTSGPFVNAKRDPFDNLDAVRANMVPPREQRERALDAIERSNRLGKIDSDYAEAATVKAQRSVAVSQHILMTGSDEYEDNFREYMADPARNAQRAALSLTPSANGGFLLPYTLDPTIVLTNSGSVNPYRQLATVKQTPTNAWNGVTSAGVNAQWLAEAAEVPDNTPTVGPINIPLHKAAAWVFGSYEILRATDFANDLPRLFGDARDRLEEAAFAVGTGTGQPRGVVTGATTLVNTATIGQYNMADVYSLTEAIPARFRSGRPAIVASLPIINRTRQFDTAGGASTWVNLGDGSPERLLGWPIYESSSLASTVANNAKIAVAGDFSQYTIVDGIGMSLLYEPMVKGPNQRPTGQSGWFVYWQTGADVTTPAAFRTLNVRAV
jgi:HK97 family phage major capsid protein